MVARTPIGEIMVKDTKRRVSDAEPPTPEWGLMLSEGRDYITRAPWLIRIPGLSVFVTVVAFNIFGDGIRDLLDLSKGANPKFRANTQDMDRYAAFPDRLLSPQLRTGKRDVSPPDSG